MIRKFSLAVVFAAIIGLAATPVVAEPITLIGSETFLGSGVFEALSGDLSASAMFVVSGSTLTITLTNTSGVDVTGPSNLLTALFFDIADNPTLTPLSAVLNLADGSTVIQLLDDGSVINGPVGIDGSLENEWSYLSDLDNPFVAKQGVGTAGFQGLFDGGTQFPGINLDGSPSTNGPDYAITSAGDNPFTFSGRETPLVQYSAIFTLKEPHGNTLGGISNVSFHYGTKAPIPEPGTLLLLGSGLAGLGFFRRKNKKRVPRVQS